MSARFLDTCSRSTSSFHDNKRLGIVAEKIIRCTGPVVSATCWITRTDNVPSEVCANENV